MIRYFCDEAQEIAAASTTRKRTTMIAPYALRAKKDNAMLPVRNKIDVIFKGNSFTYRRSLVVIQKSSSFQINRSQELICMVTRLDIIEKS